MKEKVGMYHYCRRFTAWAVYNICSGLYIILIMRAMTVASNVIAYVKRKKELSKILNTQAV